MELKAELPVPNEPISFTLKGFPVEETIVSSLERFYHRAGRDTDRRFQIFNMFKELIFSGAMNSNNMVDRLTAHDRENKPRPEEPREKYH